MDGGFYLGNSDWSNFEIADMDFWRGPAYTAFFDYLDATGGFYYEVRSSRLLLYCIADNLK